MDILKAFSLDGVDHQINIQGTPDEPLFQANQIAKLLEMKCINTSLKGFNETQKAMQKVHTPGGMQNVTFLTESGLYRLLSRSNKPIAAVFQNWMVNVIKEIRKTGQYKLDEKKEIDTKLIRLQEKNNAIKNTHNILMDFCNQKNVVYICKISNESDDNFVIKIGSTQNIKERFTRISYEYTVTPLLLNIFECNNYTKFEKWIHNNEYISSLYHSLKKTNGTIAKETFLVNEEQYSSILQIIQNQLKFFTKDDTDIEKLLELEKKRNEIEENRRKCAELELESDRLRLQQQEMALKQQELALKQEELKQKIQTNEIELTPISENNEPKPENPVLYIKNRAHTRSPKVYQYNPETLELLCTYDSIIDVIRNIPGSSPSALKESIKNNTIYKNFRWMLSDRDVTEAPVPPPTVPIRAQPIEYIAMIDIKKSKIMEVFPSQKDAAISRNLAGFSTISRAIKQGSISSGHYWNLFYKCSKEIQDEYLSKNKLPDKHVKSNGISVIKINPITNEKIKTYNSITDVLLKYQMSRISLKKASDSGEIHNGFKWKIFTPYNTHTST